MSSESLDWVLIRLWAVRVHGGSRIGRTHLDNSSSESDADAEWDGERGAIGWSLDGDGGEEVPAREACALERCFIFAKW